MPIRSSKVDIIASVSPSAPIAVTLYRKRKSISPSRSLTLLSILHELKLFWALISLMSHLAPFLLLLCYSLHAIPLSSLLFPSTSVSMGHKVTAGSPSSPFHMLIVQAWSALCRRLHIMGESFNFKSDQSYCLDWPKGRRKIFVMDLDTRVKTLKALGLRVVF